MTGIELYNFPEFDKARDFLWEIGCKVISPADMDRILGFDPREQLAPGKSFVQDAIKRDLENLQQCKSIVMLDGWEQSKGACAEHAVAEWLGLEIYEMEELRTEAGDNEVEDGKSYKAKFTALVHNTLGGEWQPPTIEVKEGPAGKLHYVKYVPNSPLPEDAAERKRIPLYSGCVDYFPLALIEVAKVSQKGSDQHHPGQPLHWDRAKSCDELDALMRHIVDHDWAAVAWRALANLQKKEEAKRGG